MGDLTEEEAENLRRSVGMLPADSPSWLSREKVLAILAQTISMLRERRGARR